MTDPVTQSVLIVGASAAGLATAEALRRFGHTGELTLLDAEAHLPYDRPPLSKQFLAGAWETHQLHLRDSSRLDELGARWALGSAAESFDSAKRSVHTADGRVHQADAVVIATGLRPRRLPGSVGLSGVHTLRSLDDAVALRRAMTGLGPVVVVGNGVLGSEIAATAKAGGKEVTLIGSSARPMAGQLGELASTVLAERHRAAGIELIGGKRVSAMGGGSSVQEVLLDDGSRIRTRTVVVAVGSEPETDWLAGSGLILDDGVVCDSHCRAAPNVWAVGDVARWRHPHQDTLVRLENRTNASEQAVAVARDILGLGAPYAPVPYFWSDQFGVRIQVFGSARPADDEVVAAGDITGDRFVVTARREGRVVGVVGWGMPKQARLLSAPLREYDERITAVS
jgi:NADPH-dependent 2,4-dienoyl-CoA reductase/sulfur reductase-like enzyme